MKIKSTTNLLMSFLYGIIGISTVMATELKQPGIYVTEKPTITEQPIISEHPLDLTSPASPLKDIELFDKKTSNQDLKRGEKKQKNKFFRTIGSELQPGSVLLPGEMIKNTDAGVPRYLALSHEGQLAYYSAGDHLVWQPDQNSKPATRLLMGLKGNLQLLAKDGNLIWQSNTWHKSAYLTVQGQLSLLSIQGERIWNPNWRTTDFYSTGAKLISGDQLLPNGMITRQGATLKMYADGQLKLAGKKVIWSSNIKTSTAVTAKEGVKSVFKNGNLAVYDRNEKKLWQTNTADHPDAELQIQGYGDFIGVRIITKKGKVLWEKGNGFKRIYRLAWRDLYMPTNNSPEKYIFGNLSVIPLGVSKVRGHSNTFWKRTSAAGSRVHLGTDESYNANNLYGFKGRYNNEFKNKFQEYELIETFEGAYDLSNKGVRLHVILWDWNRIRKNSLIGTTIQTLYFKDFKKYSETPFQIYLGNKGTSVILYFELSRIR